MPGAGAPGSLRRTWPSPCGTSARSPSWIQPAPSSPVSSHIRPEVTTWNQRYPGIGGSVESPGCGELGAAVERAVHPQEVQCLAERIRRREGVRRLHEAKYGWPEPARPACWTIEHISPPFGHRPVPRRPRQTGRIALTTRSERPWHTEDRHSRIPPAESGSRSAQTSANTGGELLAIDLELPANRRVPGGQHIHPNQAERFEVVEGTMRFRMGRKAGRSRDRARSSSSPPVRSTTSRTSATMRRSSASRCARR